MQIERTDFLIEVNQRAIALHHVVNVVDVSHGLRGSYFFLALLGAFNAGFPQLE